MIRRLAAALTVLALVLVASCSAPQSQPAPSTSPSPQAESASVDASADRSAELCPMMKGQILVLSNGFALVEASRGQSDHETYARDFSRSADDLSRDARDDNCTNLVLPAAHVAMAAAIIRAGVAASGEAGDDDYREARKAGQELMDAAGITDTKFGQDMLDR